MKTKGILIDVEKKEFREVSFSSYKDIPRLVGCEIFTSVSIGNGTCIFVDDVGLLVGRTKGFLLGGSGQPIMGNGLVSSIDGQGESVDVKVSIRMLAALVTFIDYEDSSLVPVPDITITSF